MYVLFLLSFVCACNICDVSLKTFHILQIAYTREKRTINLRKNCLKTSCKDWKRVRDSLNVLGMKMESDKQTHACIWLNASADALFNSLWNIYFIFKFSTMLFANIIAQQYCACTVQAQGNYASASACEHVCVRFMLTFIHKMRTNLQKFEFQTKNKLIAVCCEYVNTWL